VHDEKALDRLLGRHRSVSLHYAARLFIILRNESYSIFGCADMVWRGH